MQMWARNNNKRTLSESDCDDLYNDDQSKDCSSPGELLNDSHCGTSGSTGGGNMTRKRRRGIIEKRRRDRINHSLSELRRLVPSAFEKQGSAKLEKAEILQLTVDHLKMLHAKGLDALAYDPHKYAMDYHSIGFRECAAEVARYMVSVEGMDVQDPLRLRLMSHLQCLAAQRELNNSSSNGNKSGIVPASPSSVASGGGPAPVPNTPATTGTNSNSNTPAPSSAGQSWPFPPAAPYNNQHYNPPAPVQLQHHHHQPPTPGSSMHYAGMDYSGMDTNSYNPPANRLPVHHHTMSHHPHAGHTMTTLQPVQHHAHHPAAGAPAPYPHVNHHPFPSLAAAQNPNYSTSSNQVKPYRPWGAELAY